MKMKEKSEETGLKLNIETMKIMASGPVTSGQIDGETVQTVTDFIFLDCKITVDDDCSHEIKRCVLLGRKAMTNLDSVLNSRDITLSTKVCLVKAMVFPVVMYGCESWTVKKSERWRIDAFELWCWRRLLRVPWTERRSNQSILKEISPQYSVDAKVKVAQLCCTLWDPMDYSVHGILQLKLQDFGHLMWSADSLKKTLMLEKIENRKWRGNRGRDGWMALPTQWTWVWANSGRWWKTGKLGLVQFRGCKESDTTEGLNNHRMSDLPRPGTMSPTLAGGLLSTRPPRKFFPLTFTLIMRTILE